MSTPEPLQEAVVDPAKGRPYTVVVGINGSAQSFDALRWARSQAALHQGRVIALRTWRASAPAAAPSGAAASRVSTADQTEAEVKRHLAEAVEASLGPGHGVELRVVRDGRKKAFVAISEEADLIVLGAPRKMTSGPMFAHRLIYATACPVVVMPPEPTGPSAASKVAKKTGKVIATAAATAGRPSGYPRTPR